MRLHIVKWLHSLALGLLIMPVAWSQNTEDGTLGALHAETSFHAIGVDKDFASWKQNQVLIEPAKYPKVYVEATTPEGGDQRIAPKIVQKQVNGRPLDFVVVRLEAKGERFYVSKTWYDKTLKGSLTETGVTTSETLETGNETEKAPPVAETPTRPAQRSIAAAGLVSPTTLGEEESNEEEPKSVEQTYVGITQSCQENIDQLPPNIHTYLINRVTYYIEDQNAYSNCIDKKSPTYYPTSGGSPLAFIRSGFYGSGRPGYCKTTTVTEASYKKKTIDAAISMWVWLGQKKEPYKEMKHFLEYLNGEEKIDGNKDREDNPSTQFVNAKRYIDENMTRYCLAESALLEKAIPVNSGKKEILGCGPGELQVTGRVSFDKNAPQGFNQSLLVGKGLAALKKVYGIAKNPNLSCAEKSQKISDALSGTTVNTLDDYILLTYLQQNPEKVLSVPSLGLLLQQVMSMGPDMRKGVDGSLYTYYCMDGKPDCQTNRLDYITLRNFIADKSQELLFSAPFNLKNTYQFSTLSPAQQQEVAQKVVAKMDSALSNPREMYTQAEEFRKSCDAKATKFFMPQGGFCTISGCGPDSIMGEKGKRLGVSGNLLCPHYDTGRDGRFHCYVDEKLTSNKAAENTRIQFPSLDKLSCFKGTGYHIAKAHMRSCGGGFCFGGDGGGGTIDGGDGSSESGYLHVHMEIRVGKGHPKVDPVDLFCRGDCN